LKQNTLLKTAITLRASESSRMKLIFIIINFSYKNNNNSIGRRKIVLVKKTEEENFLLYKVNIKVVFFIFLLL